MAVGSDHLFGSPFHHFAFRTCAAACEELLGVSRDWSPPTATGAASTSTAALRLLHLSCPSTSTIPTMDYEGQKLSELLFHIIILAFGGVGWIFGYFAQDFSYVFYAWAAGTAISVVVSFWRREAPSRVGSSMLLRGTWQCVLGALCNLS